mmetsp:Transcript_124906/g.286214  ORF Transcript_124906/g.286214 Transcript_124906/m.286214 type:complete len:80 (-) Transcript_124906:92-331(-)
MKPTLASATAVMMRWWRVRRGIDEKHDDETPHLPVPHPFVSKKEKQVEAARFRRVGNQTFLTFIVPDEKRHPCRFCPYF